MSTETWIIKIPDQMAARKSTKIKEEFPDSCFVNN